MSSPDSAEAVAVLRWWARPTQRFFGTPTIHGRLLHNHRRGMRALRDGRLDEIFEVVRGSTRLVDWAEIDAGLPPPQAVHPDAKTWDGAVSGIGVAAKLVAVSRFGDALQYLRDAERLVRLGPPLARALLVASQGRCLDLLGDHEASLRHAEEALDLIAMTDDSRLTAEASLQSLRTRGYMSRETSIPDELRRCWEAFRAIDDRFGSADCLLEQAVRELRDGDAAAALRTATLADEVLADTDGWSALACEIAVARCVASSRAGDARSTAKLAKSLRGQYLLLEDPWWSWQIDSAVADAAIREGDTDAIAKPISRACDALERLRFRVGDVGQRSGWLLPRLQPFERALDIASRRHEPHQVLKLLERVARSALAHSLLARATQADKETSLQASRLLALSGSPSGATGPDILDDAAERDADAIGALSRRQAVLAAMVRADAGIDLDVLLDGVGGDPFLSLLETSQGLWRVWGDAYRVLGADRRQLDPVGQAVLSTVTDANASRLTSWLFSPDAPEQLAELGTLLIPDGLLDRLSPGRHLTIAAGARLSRIPYAALTCRGQRLLDVCNVSVIASLGLLAAVRRQPPALALSEPLLFAPEPDSLAGSEDQVRRLHELWPNSTVARRAAASVGSLARLSDLGALGQIAILAIAGHGEPHPSDPMRSGIRLGGGQILSAGSAMALRLPAQVELWTCSSASEPANIGPEMTGLLASCLSAGARRALGTLWPLPDKDAAPLAAAVHRHLCAGASLAASVAAAQREMRDEVPLLSWGGLLVSGAADEAAWSPT